MFLVLLPVLVTFVPRNGLKTPISGTLVCVHIDSGLSTGVKNDRNLRGPISSATTVYYRVR